MNTFKKLAVNVAVAQLTTCLCLAGSASDSASNTDGDYVVLMHGLIRSSTVMKRLEWAFAEQGYRVINLNYSSTKLSVEDAANDMLAKTLQEKIVDPNVHIHFVTHSLGGIILREYLANHTLTNLGRVVMIAPPNHGSELVDTFKGWPFFHFFTGPAGQELGTDPDSAPQRLGPAHFDLGVIAGDRTLNPFYSWFLPGPDDGKVSVSSTQLEGMDDFLIVHSSHTYLPWRKQVIEASLEFVAEGRFPTPDSGKSKPAETRLREPGKPTKIHTSPKMQVMR